LEKNSHRLTNAEIGRILIFVGKMRDPALSKDPRIKYFEFKRHKALRITIEKKEESISQEDFREYLRLS